jgi:hypothetical protein
MLVHADTRATLVRFDSNPARQSIISALDDSFLANCQLVSFQVIQRLLLLVESETRCEEVCRYLAAIARFVRRFRFPRAAQNISGKQESNHD